MNIEEFRKYKLPDEPGVYIFRDGRGKPLYVGKAGSLRNRVRSYLASDLIAGRGARIVAMVENARKLSWQKTGSVLEALILEANLIKRYQPAYNVDEKDNKSFSYLVVTKEEFPRILPVRGRELFSARGRLASGRQKELGNPRYIFGPFPQGSSLKEALKIVRKIFPYRDTCIPCKTQENTKDGPSGYQGPSLVGEKPCRPCFNRQIGLCPGVCSGEMSAREYAHVIRNIKDMFSGNFHGLKCRLAREMKVYAGDERFEEAAKRRRQIHALEHIRDVSLIKDDYRYASGGEVSTIRAVARIEAYDVAHTGGSETVAVMTVVEQGERIKAAYRKFKIRSATNDDVAALKEALSRRLAHPEWPLPRVFAVDGGKGQMNAAARILKEAGIDIPLVGVVKNEFHKPERLIGDARTIQAYERDILLANNEAHRYAISWHRKRRGKLVI